MKKAQLTTEYLLTFLFYLVLLATILISIDTFNKNNKDFYSNYYLQKNTHFHSFLSGQIYTHSDKVVLDPHLDPYSVNKTLNIFTSRHDIDYERLDYVPY